MAPHAVLNNTVTSSTPYQQQPVQHRQPSTANTSRPMTPKGTPNTRNRATKKKEQSPSISRTNSDSPIVTVGQKDNASNDHIPSSSAMQPSVLPKSKPLPTSSQLRQMDTNDPSIPRPKGIISLPTRPEATSPSKQKTRNSRTPSGRKAREGKGKAILAATNPVEEDVFSTNAHSTQERSSAMPSNVTTASRKPRPSRRASEPVSVMSDLGGEDAFGRETSKPLPTEASRRKRRREKDKDKGGGPEVKLAPALETLHIGQNDLAPVNGSILQQPRRIGLQFPLTEDDDGESTTSEAVEDISDDSGVALGEPVPIENLRTERQLNPGAKLLEELRSLSQSVPHTSDRTSRSNLDDGYHSGSGYGSAGGKSHGSRNDRSKSGRPRQGYQDQGDESAVWEMPKSEERGSGTDLTWQQSLLASPAQKPRTSAPRSNLSTAYRKNGSPAQAHSSIKRPSAGRVTQGFAPSKQQLRDHETFGTPLGQPLPLSPSITRKIPAGFTTPVKNVQRGYENSSNFATPRPFPHHTKSAPSGPAGFEMAKNSFVEEIKVYAGPTFHNSPSADSLPAPRLKGV